MTRPVRTILALFVAIVVLVQGARAQDASVTLSSESITTTDRLVITVAFRVAPGWTLGPWAASARATLEGAGWTVNAIETGEVRLADGGTVLLHTAAIELEPFLAGEYTIPAIEAVATSVRTDSGKDVGEGDPAWHLSGRPDPDGEGAIVDGSAAMPDHAAARERAANRARGNAITLATDPLTVEVVSVLPESEPDRLPLPVDLLPEPDAAQNPEQGDTPLGVLRPVPDEPSPAPVLLIVGSALVLVVGIFAVSVAVVAAGEPKRAKPTDPIRALEKLARSPDPDLAEVDRCVRLLAERHPSDRFGPIITRLEHARYAVPDASRTPALACAITKEAALLAKEAHRAGGAV